MDRDMLGSAAPAEGLWRIDWMIGVDVVDASG